MNKGCKFVPEWLDDVSIHLPSVELRIEQLMARRTVKKQWQAAWLLRAVTCIDLTTLSGDDTLSNVKRLCYKAVHPIRNDILEGIGMADKGIRCGAVCVYPAQVGNCVKELRQLGASDLPIAAVATGFPSGQYHLKTRLLEIEETVKDGATEIDIVINRSLALAGDWRGLYEELRAMRTACGSAHMKSILAIGELGTMENVYKASMVAMMAGSDFIKTSTGKEAVNATLPVGLVMARAIWNYYEKTGNKVGFKPAGGIRTAKDALCWLVLMKEELGDDWVKNDLFRIGASGLLSDIERQLFHYYTGRYAALAELPMA